MLKKWVVFLAISCLNKTFSVPVGDILAFMNQVDKKTRGPFQRLFLIGPAMQTAIVGV